MGGRISKNDILLWKFFKKTFFKINIVRHKLALAECRRQHIYKQKNAPIKALFFSPVNRDFVYRALGVARVTGLEPATSGVTGRRSNQLSYTPSDIWLE